MFFARLGLILARASWRELKRALKSMEARSGQN